MNIAAKVRQYRELHPEEYCTQCLHHIKTAAGVPLSPCPKHPVPQSFDERRAFYSDTYTADCAADDTAARMEYQTRVQGILLATTRQQSRGSVLTDGEKKEMETAYSLGLTADGLARVFIARDKTQGAA